MSGGRFREFIKENLSEKSLIIVSNRQPYLHRKTGAGVKVDKPAGGLTSAMDEALKAIGGTWVAWGSGSDDIEFVDDKNRVRVPPARPAYTLKRVWLTQEEVNNYYHGYSNHVLWPLCHISLDRVYFRKKYWDDYQKANKAFADAIFEEADNNSIVWVHDYHLCLVPQLLKSMNSKLTVAHFWHIPWPNYSVFRVCPQSTEIVEALLNNDLIGFQIPLFVHNFMECVRECLDEAIIDYKHETITYKGNVTKLMAFPISVDFDKFNTMASSVKSTNFIQKLKMRYSLAQRKVGIGVDRLEYTKGLIKRFQAIDLFFERYPEYTGKFTFIQIAVPTRLKEPYVSYKATVERFVKKINKKYSLTGWNPIIYRDTKSEHADLAAYYRMADVAIISSIYDGMNLVAKEFIASQVNKNGVLLLSEFAGAAEELEGAVLVNPYDIEEFCDSIKKVLDFDEDERMCRINTLRRQVKERDIYRWISDFLHEASILQSGHTLKSRYFFDCLDEIRRNNIFLFLDYDGTLTPIVESPDKALLSGHMHDLIVSLHKMMKVSIVSGRSLDNIRNIFNIKDVFYAGNHGAEIWAEDKLVMGDKVKEHKNVLSSIVTDMTNAMSGIQGVIVEDKGITASIHFRMVDDTDLCKMYNIFWSIADSHKGLFSITSGKKVFEIRPHGIWNKGDAVDWIWKKYGNNSTPVYIGDDLTDEDAFIAVKGKGIGISVGYSAAADYYIETQDEVEKVLRWFGDSRT
jgi:alpha,alpha-trehalose-phosphate synthase [UDP-forming]/trehalose-phosphatase